MKYIIIILLLIGTASADIETFLIEDKTNEHQYLSYYTCGHFARDLSNNANEHNITLGSVILGNHPMLKGHDNHIVNYYIDNNIIMIIEPQTDNKMYLNQTGYKYYRLYIDGTQVPSYWKYNLASVKIEENKYE